MTYRETIILGAESLRPVRRGDDLQVGSAWAKPSQRKLTASERLQRDRLERGEALGHAVAKWFGLVTGVGLVIALIAGWL